MIRITGQDGILSKFHDRAARFLVVQEDEATGELKPMTESGKPKIVMLCREAGL